MTKIFRVDGTLLIEGEGTVKDLVLKGLQGGADLTRADLRGADLTRADLRGADLHGASLRWADLRWANLCEADLCEADLCGANLRGADLTRADLRGADLTRADLRGADLHGADLTRANLRGADLHGASLRWADLSGTFKVPMFCKWDVGITDGNISIGCKTKSIEDWDKFFESDLVYDTPREIEDFKQIEAVYRGYKAYLEHLNKNCYDKN